MKEVLELRCVIQRNTAEIKRLHERIKETKKNSSESSQAVELWKVACAEFHKRYDELAFPGGLKLGLENIHACDAEAIEAGLAFLEVRPYFFRSQYLQKNCYGY
ncbi:MAG: hypothetical protein HY301_08515 [Verrucomicrobia bacterium]|nr:hypothetical protein [Verrucomicrobiota bacterium]